MPWWQMLIAAMVGSAVITSPLLIPLMVIESRREKRFKQAEAILEADYEMFCIACDDRNGNDSRAATEEKKRMYPLMRGKVFAERDTDPSAMEAVLKTLLMIVSAGYWCIVGYIIWNHSA